ncbi:MAG: hypothetical protein ACO2PM_04645 [Pyrobaculum sp.]|jgi:hypothetical protein
MGGRAVGQAGGGEGLPPVAEYKSVLKFNDAVAPHETLLCEKIRRETSLIPPAFIDALCNGESLPWICLEALFVDELRSVARALGRGHLLRFVKCGPE